MHIELAKKFTVLILLIICTIGIVSAQNNTTTTPTDTSPGETTTANITAKQTTEQPTVVATTMIVPTTTPVPTEGKFRVGPTVRIRPLNDEINKNQDGLIELYMDNPSLNDVTLSVDARVSVPSGIHVYGQGFGEAGAAGMVYGKFTVPPGSARTINIVVKAEKLGDFSAQFSGLYWPGDNKDAFQPISLTHPFKVTAASTDPLKDPTGEGEAGNTDKPVQKVPGISMMAAISIFAMAYIIGKRWVTI